MATAQAVHPTCTSNKPFRDIYQPSQPEAYTMGSVGSLIEKPELSPERVKSRHTPAQHDGLLKKGLTQKELLNYLNITKKDPKSSKHIISSIKKEHGRDEENFYSRAYHKDGKEVDVGKNSLPVGGKFEKSRFRPSAFKTVTPKSFSSVQNLYPGKSEEAENGLSNGLHLSYAKVTSTATSSSSSSPSRHGVGARKVLPAEEENMSDSGHNSMNSLPPYRPPFRPHLAQISASTGHINHIGSLDRASVGSKGTASTTTDMSCQSMATLNRLQCYGSEAPPPYELSQSLEDVVRDLEERLLEKEHELKQMRRNLDESEGAIAQVFEGKQRLWEKEVEEIKRLYATKLRQVSQHAQRSQRTLQLQLFKAQQERRRLQEELETAKGRSSGSISQEHNPALEETQWEVCQKSGEISLLKQQLRDSQAEVTQKLSEIFQMKTQLREAASEEERLRAELLLERRQSEAQAGAFQAERRIWHSEKDKVIRYQKELQASYLEMYRKNQVLEKELLELRGARAAQEEQADSLPWIERIESSEI